jgi:transcriptional regulator with GAF, ATPase, and Fis domain
VSKKLSYAEIGIRASYNARLKAVMAALKRSKGNVTLAAKELQMNNPTQLNAAITKMGLREFVEKQRTKAKKSTT